VIRVRQGHRSLVGGELAGDDVEEGRLSGAVWTDQSRQRSLANFEIDARSAATPKKLRVTLDIVSSALAPLGSFSDRALALASPIPTAHLSDQLPHSWIQSTVSQQSKFVRLWGNVGQISSLAACWWIAANVPELRVAQTHRERPDLEVHRSMSRDAPPIVRTNIRSALIVDIPSQERLP